MKTDLPQSSPFDTHFFIASIRPWCGFVLQRCLPVLFPLYFLLIASQNLLLPGLYGDEVLQITPVLPVIEGHPDQSFAGIPDTQVTIGGHPLALMTMRYLGSLKTILFLPVAGVFGESMHAIRLFTLTIAAITLLATYQFTMRIFSRRAAFVSVLLLSMDQSFILRMKVDWGPNAIAIMLKMLALVALVHWWRTQRAVSLAVGGLLLGLALYNKSDFSYMLAALVIATGIVYCREIRLAFSWRNLTTFVGSFVAGASVFIWYNIRWPFISFRDGNPDHVKWWHPDAYWAALQERIHRFFELLNGMSMNFVIGLGPQNIRPFSFGTIMGAVFVGALVIALAIVTLAHGKSCRVRRPLTWIVLVIVFFLLFCAATPAAFAHHHVINIYPFPHILVGVAFSEGVIWLVRNAPPIYRRGLPIIAGLVLVSLIMTDVSLLRNTYTVLEMTGGAGRWSDSVYTLSEDLRQRPVTMPVHIMDWGIIGRVDVLLEGQIDGIDEPWPFLGDPAQVPTVAAHLLEDPRAEYVISPSDVAAFPLPWVALKAYAQQHGEDVQIIKTYNQRNGIPALQRCKFVRTSSSAVSSAPTAPSPSLSSSNLSAIPNPVPTGSSKTTIAWYTKDGSIGQIYVSTNGQREVLFAQGTSGSQEAPWIKPGVIYVFRLYAGLDHRTLISTITVAASST